MVEKGSQNLIVVTIFFCLFHLIIGFPDNAVSKHLKIVVVKSKDVAQYNLTYDGFVEVLKKSGLNFQTKIYSLDKSYQSITRIISEITNQKPDLVLTIGTLASQEISQKISKLPVIFSMVLNPEAQGLTKSTTYLEKNLSGICLDVPVETQFRVMKQCFPDFKRVAVLYHPVYDSIFVEQAKKLAEKFVIDLIAERLRLEKEIPSILNNLLGNCDVIWLIPNPYSMSNTSLKYILKFCIGNNFPVIGLSEYHVETGALMALRADYQDIGRQAGDLAIEVIRNGRQIDPIIVNPRKTQLFLNKKTAEKMGITIPALILKHAEQVYE